MNSQVRAEIEMMVARTDAAKAVGQNIAAEVEPMYVAAKAALASTERTFSEAVEGMTAKQVVQFAATKPNCLIFGTTTHSDAFFSDFFGPEPSGAKATQ